MRKITADLLPKIAPKAGTVHTQFVRCGKPGCKCSRGELHGPYHYYFVRSEGRLGKRYLKPAEREAIQAACNDRRRGERAQRQQTRIALQCVRRIIAKLREIQENP